MSQGCRGFTVRNFSTLNGQDGKGKCLEGSLGHAAALTELDESKLVFSSSGDSGLCIPVLLMSWTCCLRRWKNELAETKRHVLLPLALGCSASHGLKGSKLRLPFGKNDCLSTFSRTCVVRWAVHPSILPLST